MRTQPQRNRNADPLIAQRNRDADPLIAQYNSDVDPLIPRRGRAAARPADAAPRIEPAWAGRHARWAARVLLRLAARCCGHWVVPAKKIDLPRFSWYHPPVLRAPPPRRGGRAHYCYLYFFVFYAML